MKNSIAHAQPCNANQWVHRNELRAGMYVVELDTPWEKTPFMFQGFELRDSAMVEQVQQFCEYALVHNQVSVAPAARRLAGASSTANKGVWKHNAK